MIFDPNRNDSQQSDQSHYKKGYIDPNTEKDKQELILLNKMGPSDQRARKSSYYKEEAKDIANEPESLRFPKFYQIGVGIVRAADQLRVHTHALARLEAAFEIHAFQSLFVSPNVDQLPSQPLSVIANSIRNFISSVDKVTYLAIEFTSRKYSTDELAYEGSLATNLLRKLTHQTTPELAKDIDHRAAQIIADVDSLHLGFVSDVKCLIRKLERDERRSILMTKKLSDFKSVREVVQSSARRTRCGDLLILAYDLLDQLNSTGPSSLRETLSNIQQITLKESLLNE